MNSADLHISRLEWKHFKHFIEENLSPNKTVLFPPSSNNPLEEIKAQAERDAIIQVLKLCGGNKTEAAKLLKISRPLLYQKMKRLQIDVNQ